jgi:hypothetical protein
MGEFTEKIYCCDRGDNDNALAAAILAGNNRRDDWGPMAAMMGGGMNNWMNNPFAYLMFMALLRNGGFGFGGDGAGTATQGIETQAQLNAIRTQLQDNQNADCIKSAIQGNGFALSQLAQTLNIDFNTLQKCCCDVQAAIQQVAGQVGFSAERVINERFVVTFQGRTTLPTSVTINQLGMTQGLIKIVCGKSNCYAINSSLSVSIPAEPAA